MNIERAVVFEGTVNLDITVDPNIYVDPPPDHTSATGNIHLRLKLSPSALLNQIHQDIFDAETNTNREALSKCSHRVPQRENNSRLSDWIEFSPCCSDSKSEQLVAFSCGVRILPDNSGREQNFQRAQKKNVPFLTRII